MSVARRIDGSIPDKFFLINWILQFYILFIVNVQYPVLVYLFLIIFFEEVSKH